MHPPDPYLVSTVATRPDIMVAVANNAASHLAWILLSGLAALVAVVRVLRQPAQNWKHRNWSKLAWIGAALSLPPVLGGYPIPIGAVAAIWRTRQRTTRPDAPGQIPHAQGSPDWPFPWSAR